MKIEVYRPDVPEEKTIRLALIQHDWNEVTLAAVDADGEQIQRGRLISISPGGQLRRCVDINRELGLHLDREGRIVVEGE
jgi:hypothetical protein